MSDDAVPDRSDRLDDYLDANELEAAWFAQPNAFAWLTGGSNVVDRAGTVGVAAAGYVRDGDGELRVVTDDIEAQRLVDEELPDGVEVEAGPWYKTSLAERVAAASPTPAAADFDVPGFETVDASPLRQPLSEYDVERYRALGAGTAEAVEAIAREVDPDDTEREVAAGLRIALAGRDIHAPVVLVGGAERARRYRHYTPTDAEIGDYALLSVTAERGGLYASTTRTVAFDPPEWLNERHAKAMQVEATALGATREVARLGGPAASVFHGIQAAYEHLGHRGEWRKHHQGGAAGYAGREWIATPDLDAPVTTPMAYAWNPTIEGAKSEDTVLVTEDGFEVLTSTGEWPTARVMAYDYPAAVVRHKVLHLG
ncbi:M24 family metallopeptidase [Halegenticoccus tardaugens]|uniref:M24 family metallopeptidase n=1 Tax=Halegenticoccus tardaugens TaxID=2071624 RepID=UPI00100B3812|nr:M24 family metallopeptidase [Halegenticoccus tardaugens]